MAQGGEISDEHVTSLYLSADHSSMVKYSKRNDSDYEIVMIKIRQMVMRAMKDNRQSGEYRTQPRLHRFRQMFGSKDSRLKGKEREKEKKN